MSAMLPLLVFTTQAAADAANAKAFAHLQATQGARGNAWSEIVSDGTSFGICDAPAIAPALTPQELSVKLSVPLADAASPTGWKMATAVAAAIAVPVEVLPEIIP